MAFVRDDNNVRPVARDETFFAYHVPTGNSVDILVLNKDSDDNRDPLTITGVTAPSFGAVNISADAAYITYTPNGAFVDDSFQYAIQDDHGGTAVATVTIDDEMFTDPYGGYGGGGGSSAPTANDDFFYGFNASQTRNLHLLNNDTDPDGNQLTISGITTAPGAGQAAVSADGSYVTYTSNAAFSDDTFVYEVSDGNGNTATATVTLDDLMYGGYGGASSTPPFQPETITSMPAGPAVVGQLWQYTLAATGGVAYSLDDDTAPVGMTLQNNIISWTPTELALDSHITIWADTNESAWTEQSFDLPVVSQLPASGFYVDSIPAGPAIEGDLYTYNLSVQHANPSETFT
ncbi:MAG: Ig-like domain-containing protein [Pirellulales bacterium]